MERETGAAERRARGRKPGVCVCMGSGASERSETGAELKPGGSSARCLQKGEKPASKSEGKEGSRGKRRK